MTGVGNRVGVEVGGNHTIVGVTVATINGVSVGITGEGVDIGPDGGTTVHDHKKKLSVQNTKIFFILLFYADIFGFYNNKVRLSIRNNAK
jgi:hypothetical protein